MGWLGIASMELMSALWRLFWYIELAFDGVDGVSKLVDTLSILSRRVIMDQGSVYDTKSKVLVKYIAEIEYNAHETKFGSKQHFHSDNPYSCSNTNMNQQLEGLGYGNNYGSVSDCWKQFQAICSNGIILMALDWYDLFYPHGGDDLEHVARAFFSTSEHLVSVGIIAVDLQTYVLEAEAFVKVVGWIMNEEVELWVGKVLMFVFDPGGSSWFYNGCGCVPFVSNGDTKIFDKFTETNVGSGKDLLRVIPFTKCASYHSHYLLLITNGSLNMENKNWVSSFNKGWMLPTDSAPWSYSQVLQLKNLAGLLLEEMLYNRDKALFQAELLLVINAKRNVVHIVRLGYQNTVLQRVAYKNISLLDGLKHSQAGAGRGSNIEHLVVGRMDIKGAPIVTTIVRFSERLWLRKFHSNGDGSSAGKEMKDIGLNIMNIGLDMLRPKKFELGLLLSDYKHLAQYMSSNEYDVVAIAKLEDSVWDPGQNIIFLYILEDKDVFERVGKDIVLMDTTLVIRRYDHERQMGCLDDIGLIPKTLIFSTAELEHYIWDPGSFVPVSLLS